MSDLTESQDFLADVMGALSHGDKKYGAGSWKDLPTKKFLGAVMRHVGAHLKGELFDPESGLPHLAHAAANLVIIWRKR